MSRRIHTTSLQSSGIGGEVDGYFDRIIKYIPGDIVAAWAAISALVKGATDTPTGVLWLVLVLFAVLTPIWTLRQTRVPKAPPAILQAILSTTAFVVWVFALGDPFSALEFYRPVYGAIALIVFTVISGMIVPSDAITPSRS
jgi:hypothetical protein